MMVKRVRNPGVTVHELPPEPVRPVMKLVESSWLQGGRGNRVNHRRFEVRMIKIRNCLKGKLKVKTKSTVTQFQESRNDVRSEGTLSPTPDHTLRQTTTKDNTNTTTHLRGRQGSLTTRLRNDIDLRLLRKRGNERGCLEKSKELDSKRPNPP